MDVVNIYEAADAAIRIMNRENLKDFGQLKASNFEQLNVIRAVTTLYRQSRKRARRKYFEIAFEAYLIGMAECRVEPKKAQKMAEKAITMDWVDEILEQTDFVTLYRFDRETERKAQRLIEELSETQNRDYSIDKALRFWSQQLGQYAINFTDYAEMKAFEDAGIEMAEWVSVEDERRCMECHALHGQIFRIKEFPRKPHWGCRCRKKPVFRTAED